MKRTLAAAVAISGSLLMSTGVQAAECADRTQVVERLKNEFNETLTSVSEIRNNAVLEVFSSYNNETWTVMLTLPARGLSCMVATGKADESLEARMPNRTFVPVKHHG
ncbi:MAG: hypothetical protein JXQ97_15655 [Natronospirillum sp.]